MGMGKGANQMPTNSWLGAGHFLGMWTAYERGPWSTIISIHIVWNHLNELTLFEPYQFTIWINSHLCFSVVAQSRMSSRAQGLVWWRSAIEEALIDGDSNDMEHRSHGWCHGWEWLMFTMNGTWVKELPSFVLPNAGFSWLLVPGSKGCTRLYQGLALTEVTKLIICKQSGPFSSV